MKTNWLLMLFVAVASGCSNGGSPAASANADAGGGGAGGVGGDGGAGGTGGQGGSPPVQPICDPGAKYTCACAGGGTGNKWCTWDGLGYTPCDICGPGGTELTGQACNTASDCPGIDGYCQSRGCKSGNCVAVFANPGTVLQDDQANDCRELICDGSGHTVIVPDATDCAGTCTADGVCSM